VAKAQTDSPGASRGGSGIVPTPKSERTRVENGIVTLVCYSVDKPILLVRKNGAWIYEFGEKHRKPVGTVLKEEKYDGPVHSFRKEVFDHFTLHFTPPPGMAEVPSRRLYTLIKTTEVVDSDHFDTLKRHCAKKYSCNCGGRHHSQYREGYDTPDEVKKDFYRGWKKSYSHIGTVSFDDEVQ
jgi:hypothetical protein